MTEIKNYKYIKKDGSSLDISLEDTFNRLAIKSMYKGNGKVYCDCLCSCGNEKNHVVIHSLVSGNTKSCGCLNDELRRKRNFKHGNACRNEKSRLYKIWVDMKRRCDNGKRKGSKNYHDKGIIYCNEWSDFKIFKKWALSNGYNDELTIERKDNSQGYNPDNCCWIKFSEQSKNRTTNHYITYNNETHTLSEWARIRGINRATLNTRLRRGWDIKTALEF